MSTTLNHLTESRAQLAEASQLGAAPDDLALVLRDLNDENPSAREVPARMPLYGGARGALNARGAEAAARGLSRLAAAARMAVRR
jgi:hypothetical protein